MQVGPSQPSLQTQVNVSPATTQVPPFSHGFGRQLEFLAERDKRGKTSSQYFFGTNFRGLSIKSAIADIKKPQETSADLAFFVSFHLCPVESAFQHSRGELSVQSETLGRYLSALPGEGDGEGGKWERQER